MLVNDSSGLLEAASRWMRDRNWHQLLGKHGSYVQSLYHHTSVQLNFLLALRPLLCNEAGLRLTEDQFLAVFVGTLCHDVGKADSKWQHALRSAGTLPHHVDGAKARVVAEEWAQRLGRSELQGFVPSILAAIALHHKATQGVASTLDQLLHGGQNDSRWREIADLVEAVDKICSVSNVGDAAELADKLLGSGAPEPRFSATFHRVQVLRGVSTTFVHKACQEAHIEAGWTPVIHYSDGTLYFSLAQAVSLPTLEDVRPRLASLFGQLLREADLPQQVVGNLHGGDPLPKPELFDANHFGEYLRVAASRSKAANFRKRHRKPDGSFHEKFQKYLAKYKSLRASAAQADDGATFERFVMAVPLDGMFRFFKAAVLGDKIISEDTWPLTEEKIAEIENSVTEAKGDAERKAAKRERLIGKARSAGRAAWLRKVHSAYEEQFGPGSFDNLGSISNDPALNLAKAVDYFFDQGSTATESTGVLWSSVEPRQQQAEVEKRLKHVFSLGKESLPAGVLQNGLDAAALTDAFLGGIQLHHRAPDIDVEANFSSYLFSKVIGERHSFCPLSNEPALGGAGTGSGMGVSTAGHSNRLPMQGFSWENWRKTRTGGGVPLAHAERYELMLRGLILGRAPEQVIVLLPPAQLGLAEGRQLVDQLSQLDEEVQLFSSGLSPDSTRRFSFSLTDEISRRWSANESAPLSALLSYRSAEQTARKHRRDFDRSMQQLFGIEQQIQEDDSLDGPDRVESMTAALASLNDDLGAQFQSWDEAIDEIYLGQSDVAKTILISSRDVLAIRAEAQKQNAPGRFVCQTPNMIVALLPQPISVGKDSEVNGAIRQLMLSLVLNAALGISVAIIRDDESLTFPGTGGSVLIPRNPALRAQVARVRRNQAAGGQPSGAGLTGEWLLPDEAEPWLRATVALHELARERTKRSKGKAQQISIFPERSAMYDVLSARSAGFVLKRLEDKLGRSLEIDEFRVLDTLQPFLG
jgi:hypothetical protein